MKSIVTFFAIAAAASCVEARPVKTDADWSTLFNALAPVESGGRAHAIGDGGKAVGLLQIHAAVIADVNRVYGTQFTWPECAKDPAKSTQVARLYISHWSRVNLKRPPTFEEAARIWNGGPRGYSRQATVVYWQRVQKHL